MELSKQSKILFAAILIVSMSAFICRPQMWYLFKVISFILNLGTTSGAFQYRRSANPEANMNIVSY